MAQNTTIFTRRESEARSYCRGMNAVFTRASGSEMFDAEGNRYIDFLAGCSSLNYGHNDPDMKAALIEHITNDGIAHGLDFHSETKAAFLTAYEEKILKPRGMDYKVMMTGPTGTNAVEAAIKLARKVTGRKNVISFTNGFHGMTMGALALTGNAGKRGGAGGGSLADVTHMPFEGSLGENVDTLEMIDAMLSNPSSGIDAPAAFIFEPIQGEGGLNAASDAWMQGIEKIARKHGALLIIDDIQAGCGRSGSFFSFEASGIKPDMITQAKSLSGFGLPFAALLIAPEHDIWKPAEHNGTFRGNTHAFVTARVAIEKFWSDDTFEKSLAEKAVLLTTALKDVADLVDGATLKGRGLMQGVDVGSGELAGAICARAYELGLVIETSGANDEIVKYLAPLTTPEKVMREGFDILLQATRDVTGNMKLAAE
ncbi:diaminobutyrate--2-oxoglutarate transaminase [Sulfitobacter sp. M85]|nr:diaminobutyrate--2-oxoglutarate transaminase [Sulfitobacter sp. Ks11]MDF3385136.1 diaminobutyrate--2-oxoglutarate transaminase [Sulfitobacter sp. M85]MDF3388555.1 diaminobutyrate--2-oxoglutarate transaminase [Sulfitobacter sp. Ks16]MDF3399192.1 diaminobutyrate--2-oxoglutarate transaminase [Sulfitobacter sp. KE39]MDF3402613.1 diaminobutyrate--2-oxoglutarate transaminase [Sulfitobacter sp. Ks35]MDF3409691.1 diaminobutyrate--2-oxoglutarate transaminase [Sulfitobacter sp. KE38]